MIYGAFKKVIFSSVVLLSVLMGNNIYCQNSGGVSVSQLSEKNAEKAKKLFQRAIKFFENKNYVFALSNFQSSYAFKPHWKIKYNIAVCHYQLGNYLESANNLREFLMEGGKKLTEEDRKNAESLIKELRGKLGSVIFYGDLPEVDVIIDGMKIIISDESREVFLPEGTHHIIVSSSGKIFVDQRLEFSPGRTRELHLAILLESAPATKQAGENAGSGKVKKEKKRKKKFFKHISWKEATGWSLAGLSASFFAGAIVTGVLTINERKLMKKAEDGYMKRFDDPDVTQEILNEIRATRDKQYKRGRTLLFLTIGLLSAGGVTAVSSSTLLALFARKKVIKEKPIHAGKIYYPQLEVNNDFFSISFNVRF